MAIKRVGVRPSHFSRFARWTTSPEDIQPIYPVSPSGSSIIPAVQTAVFIGGKRDGEQIQESFLESNSVAKLSFGFLTPRQGCLRVVVNPSLFETAVVQGPVLIEEKELQEIFIIIRASKKTSLELPWLVRLYSED